MVADGWRIQYSRGFGALGVYATSKVLYRYEEMVSFRSILPAFRVSLRFAFLSFHLPLVSLVLTSHPSLTLLFAECDIPLFQAQPSSRPSQQPASSQAAQPRLIRFPLRASTSPPGPQGIRFQHHRFIQQVRKRSSPRQRQVQLRYQRFVVHSHRRKSEFNASVSLFRSSPFLISLPHASSLVPQSCLSSLSLKLNLSSRSSCCSLTDRFLRRLSTRSTCRHPRRKLLPS